MGLRDLTDSPARRCKRLAGGTDGERPLPHARQRRDPDVLLAVKRQAVVLAAAGRASAPPLDAMHTHMRRRTTSSARTSTLCLVQISASRVSSSRVKHLPDGLCGVLMMTTLVLLVNAALHARDPPASAPH